MKLLLVIVQDADAARLQQALVESNFRATKLATTGGFLREGNTTFLIGVNDKEVETVTSIVRTTCHERTQPQAIHPLANSPEPYFSQVIDISVGGAVIFVVNVESFQRV
jgi:uncharacterized protein YaaQ